MATVDGPGGGGIDPRRTWKVLALRGPASIIAGLVVIAEPATDRRPGCSPLPSASAPTP